MAKPQPGQYWVDRASGEIIINADGWDPNLQHAIHIKGKRLDMPPAACAEIWNALKPLSETLQWFQTSETGAQKWVEMFMGLDVVTGDPPVHTPLYTPPLWEFPRTPDCSWSGRTGLHPRSLTNNLADEQLPSIWATPVNPPGGGTPAYCGMTFNPHLFGTQIWGAGGKCVVAVTTFPEFTGAIRQLCSRFCVDMTIHAAHLWEQEVRYNPVTDTWTTTSTEITGNPELSCGVGLLTQNPDDTFSMEATGVGIPSTLYRMPDGSLQGSVIGNINAFPAERGENQHVVFFVTGPGTVIGETTADQHFDAWVEECDGSIESGALTAFNWKSRYLTFTGCDIGNTKIEVNHAAVEAAMGEVAPRPNKPFINP